MDKNKKIRRGIDENSGFTLVEMIMYVALLSIVIVSISTQSTDVIRTSSSINELIYVAK